MKTSAFYNEEPGFIIESHDNHVLFERESGEKIVVNKKDIYIDNEEYHRLDGVILVLFAGIVAFVAAMVVIIKIII